MLGVQVPPGLPDAMKRIKNFLQEVWVELRKVSWTTRKEIIDSTAVVIIALGVIGICVGVIDYVFQIGILSGRHSILNWFR